nr:MAG TPA: hypothetical protein [Caudoviricetes sp.]
MIDEPTRCILMFSGVFLLMFVVFAYVTRSFIEGVLYTLLAILSLAGVIFIVFIPTLIYKFIVL